MSTKHTLKIDVINAKESKNIRGNNRGGDKVINNFFDKHNKVQAAFNEKAQRVIDERAEARRLVSLANKRLRRLEEKGYTNSPAYQATDGYFSVKGKSQQQIQSMLREMNKFIDATTSTIRGTNAYAKELASNTGVSYTSIKDLQKKIPKFFELTSKVEQYLRNVEDMASAIDYNQIWEKVNIYVKDNSIDLSQADGDIDGMIKHVVDALKQFDTTDTVAGTTFRLKK